jgi:hypothetical protein
MSIRCLLVTCCLDPSRYDILRQVVDNLGAQTPSCLEQIDVFDNASIVEGTHELLSRFNHVYRADRNVGFWSAIDWWLDQMRNSSPDYVYVIESDLIHHAWDRISECTAFLDNHPDVGGVRAHEYSVADKHLYNKDAPLPGSNRRAWRSHRNIVTGERVELTRVSGDLYITNFPAHIPAINRYDMIDHAFRHLGAQPAFSEHDFQRVCHEKYQKMGLIDGGLYKELAFNGSGATGSFLDACVLNRMGYQTTRTATIIPRNEYIVTTLR